jgi:aminoglycoside/choline kinase family phosphotransferase
VLWLHAERGPRTVACNAKGEITDFAVREPGKAGTYTYCGVQLFHPRLIEALPPAPFCSVIDASRNLMRKGQPTYGCESEGAYWADLGTPARYLQAHADAPEVLRARRSEKVKVTGHCKGSVLWDGATVDKGVAFVHSIAGRNVHVHLPVQDSCVVRADLASMPAIVARVLRQLRMSPAQTLYMQLPRRGSNRNFVRLVDQKKSVILIQYDTTIRPENARYAEHARFLSRQGIPVPKVLIDQPDQGCLVLQDVGQESLQDVKTSQRDVWYPRTLKYVRRLHGIPLPICPPLEVSFDLALYKWEHDLFLDHFLSRHDTCSPALRDGVADELEDVAHVLNELPRVLVHRDLQSSNILLHKNHPVFIDFQGMRAGPAVYDLASLLYDPYISLSDEQRARYLSVYLKGMDPEVATQIQEMLPWAGIQRLVQALGAFGRLAADPATRRFEEHIPVARKTLCWLLKQTGACPSLQALFE